MSKLIKRARLAGRILRFVPFLRMAALNGSIVRGVENKQSDIDILIIASAGRLYTCRAFATVLIHLTGYRRHGQKIVGRLCLNCYLNDKNPNIFPQRKSSARKVARAYKYLIPLVDDGILRKFLRTNRWFEEFSVEGESHSQLLKSHCFSKFPLQGFNPCKTSSCHCAVLGAEPKSNVSSKQSAPCHPALPPCHPERSCRRQEVEGSKHRLPRPVGLAMTNLLELLLSGKFGDSLEQKLMDYQIKKILSSQNNRGELIATRDEIRLHPRKNTKLFTDTKYIF